MPEMLWAPCTDCPNRNNSVTAGAAQVGRNGVQSCRVPLKMPAANARLIETRRGDAASAAKLRDGSQTRGTAACLGRCRFT